MSFDLSEAAIPMTDEEMNLAASSSASFMGIYLRYDGF